jgi:hypothetical protein
VARFRTYFFSLIPVLILALVYPEYNVIENNIFANFISWGFIGLWILLVVSFIDKIRRTVEFRSDQNSLFFLWGSLFPAIIFACWGDYTTLLRKADFFQVTELYINLWMVIIAVPFLIYGIAIHIAVFSKYYSIFVGNRQMDARRVGFLTTFIIIIWSIVWLIDSELILNPLIPDLQQNQEGSINLCILSLLVVQIFLFIYGIIKPRPSLGSFDSRRLQARINTMDNSLRNADRLTSNVSNQQQRESNRRDAERRENARREAQRRESQRQQQNRLNAERQQAERHEAERRAIAQREQSRSKVKPISPTSSFNQKDLANLRPKTGTLSEDDFKCIFCFHVPKLPQDQRRDIIICPNCHYPAHVEEFISWIQNSPYCSRCESPLPSHYRTNPPRIPTATYLKAMKILLKK